MTIKTVVFDLGGTLIEYAGPYETWPDLETPGFKAAYAVFSGNGHALPDFLTFRDAGFDLLPQMWQAATRHEQNLRVVDLLVESLRAVGVQGVDGVQMETAAFHYGAAIQKQAWLIDRAVETVAAAKEAGYQLGLVSNTMFPGSLHMEDMSRFGLIEYFDGMVFSADVDKWKPAAAPFLQVLDELGAEADTAVYIGDDPASDVVGGLAAGMKTIYFKGNGRFHKPDHIQPHAEINSLDELLPLLQRW